MHAAYIALFIGPLSSACALSAVACTRTALVIVQYSSYSRTCQEPKRQPRGGGLRAATRVERKVIKCASPCQRSGVEALESGERRREPPRGESGWLVVRAFDRRSARIRGRIAKARRSQATYYEAMAHLTNHILRQAGRLGAALSICLTLSPPSSATCASALSPDSTQHSLALPNFER